MTNAKDGNAERPMEQADEVSGEGRPDGGGDDPEGDDAANDAEKKYGEDESPA
jgi:hypothetical protein